MTQMSDCVAALAMALGPTFDGDYLELIPGVMKLIVPESDSSRQWS